MQDCYLSAAKPLPLPHTHTHMHTDLRWTSLTAHQWFTRQQPLSASPSSPLRESYAADRDSTSMQLPIIGMKKGWVEEMLYQGSGESGIGVQTAIQQCQPADGRLGAYVGPLVSHRKRHRTWGAMQQQEAEALQSLDSSLWRRQILTVLWLETVGLASNKKSLPASCCEHLRFPRLPLPFYPLSSLSLFLTTLTVFFLKHHRSKSADKRLYKFSQAFKNYHHFIMDNHS